MMSPVPGPRHLLTAVAAGLLISATGASAVEPPAREMGAVFGWGPELRQQNLPAWRPGKNPFTTAQWARQVNSIIRTAGQNGMWFSGSTALPFDLPINRVEPKKGWFNPANYLRHYNETGVKFDVNLELRVAKLAKVRKLHKSWNIKLRIAARRYNMLGTGWQRTALSEIRRIVPKYRDLPYKSYYTGVDEPMFFPPFGPAVKSTLGKRFVADIQRLYGQPSPAADERPTDDPGEGLKWLAFNRFTGERYIALRTEQTRLIKQLDPNGLVSPNSYAFIDGFIPWDYTRFGEFADVIEVDPYTSYDEVQTPGRGRYNHGFGTKLFADLTGVRIRAIIQAFPYRGYDPQPEDVWTWATQALRAGATDLTLYAENNPRSRRPKVYAGMLAIAKALRGTRLPAAPVDPKHVIVYATASEAQGQPQKTFGERPRTVADQLYTTYSVLGELSHSAFVFDSDTRLVRDPARLARTTTMWLPRGETLDRPFVDAVIAWVRSGGTLIVTDPDAFTRAPDGSSLADLREVLIGAATVPAAGGALTVPAAAIAPALPARPLTVAVTDGIAGAFDRVPSGAQVIATNVDGSPAALRRVVGAGQVLAFAGDVMFPQTLNAPGEIVALVTAIQNWRGASMGVPAWRYEIPGNPAPGRLPWRTAVRPLYSSLP